jgi:hypothetical protein
VTGEIDAAEAAAGRGRPAGRSGERASPGKRGMQPAGGGQAEGSAAAGSRPSAEDDRAARKEVARLEKSIARLDAEKKERQAALLETTDPAAAVELHTALTEVEGKLAAAEERWLELQEQLAG